MLSWTRNTSSIEDMQVEANFCKYIHVMPFKRGEIEYIYKLFVMLY